MNIGESRSPVPQARQVALVTGASSGIGRAVALALARTGTKVFAAGRDPARLAETLAAAPTGSLAGVRADLTNDVDVHALVDTIASDAARLDVLVHAAGIIETARLEDASVDAFDRQFATNVRAPYLLTQRLLSLLTKAHGQIVFLNSSAGLGAARPGIAQYAATKHAFKAVADSLRAEVNPMGIRVLSVYLGRTATPMQEAVCRQEQKVYRPERLLQPEDVASLVLAALALPMTAEVTDVSIRPMLKD